MQTALLIIDMQKFFGDMVDKPLPHIKRLEEFFNETGRLVVYTQHGHTPDELIRPIKNQLIRKVGPENALMVNTEDWELIPAIWKLAGDAPVIGKNTYDAFIHNGLEVELKKRGVERVLVTGVMSNVCCNTTARSAFVRGYETWYVSDACYTDTEERHQRAIDDIEFVLGRVHTAGSAISELKAEQR